MGSTDDSDAEPLTETERTALRRVAAVATGESGIARSRAVDLLVEEGFERADAADVLDTLHDRGHLYAVDGALFVTDPDAGP